MAKFGKYGLAGVAVVFVLMAMFLFAFTAYNAGSLQTRGVLLDQNLSPSEAVINVGLPALGGILSGIGSLVFGVLSSLIKLSGGNNVDIEKLKSLLVIYNMLKDSDLGNEAKTLVETFKKLGFPTFFRAQFGWKDGTQQKIDYGVEPASK
jgi:hypothetical protein